jgi:hypothetical protein
VSFDSCKLARTATYDTRQKTTVIYLGVDRFADQPFYPPHVST